MNLLKVLKGSKMKFECEKCGYKIDNLAKEDYFNYCPHCNSLMPPLDKGEDGLHCNYCEKKIEGMDYTDSCPWCEEVLCDTFDSYAEMGNPEAQYIVASYYLTHVLDDVDAATKRPMAREYMKKAAEQGHSGAILFLRKRRFSED